MLYLLTLLPLLFRPTLSLPLDPCPPIPDTFYLITAPDPSCPSPPDSTNATSLFSPIHNPTYTLRQIGPGYLSLPLFTLTNGTLHTTAPDAFGQGSYDYASVPIQAGEQNAQLRFERADGVRAALDGVGQGDGGLSLMDGYALGVEGEGSVGWGLCPGQLGVPVITWNGVDPACVPTVVQAAGQPPY
ncbi:hypothetical protein EJ06DRAFT_484034 [Trichodelitschia bisporula]|uniref:Cell wall protein PhiA n=1 Tax=Trichodelitschia bisporula TaxID=703511 RepID=A0A6G1HK68_9PEZI|nr:hypothetical protein EJ06DRAFT_484034 [Trichodelitschia bisporula]